METRPNFEHTDMLLPIKLMREWKHSHLSWFGELDRHAHLLEEFLANQLKSTRLGMYAEKLLHFYFLHAPGFELLAANEQVPPSGKTRIRN
jgi:hypothetical protein